MNIEKLVSENKHILETFTRDRGYVNVHIEQIDILTGKILNTFKNRYCAARYIIESKLSNYLSPKGLGQTRACMAGNLTNSLVTTGKAYGYYWRLVSPTKKVKITKSYERTPTVQSRYTSRPYWLILNGIKTTPLRSIHDIQMTYGWSKRKIRDMINNNIVVDGLSIIPSTSFPKEKSFKSYREISKFLRISQSTARDIVKNRTINKGYICVIDPATMQGNMLRTKALREYHGN